MTPSQLSPYSRKVLKSLNDAIMVSRMSHWNVRGPNFYECHLLFGKVYDSLSDLTDGLVETLRAFEFSPNFAEFAGPDLSMETYDCYSLCQLTLEYVATLTASLALFLEKLDSLDRDPRFPGLENHIQNASDTALTAQYLLQAYLGM